MTSTLTSETRTRIVDRHDRRSWVRTVGRIGIASRGVIYLLLAYLALDIARHGSAPSPTSSTGALQELEARTGGTLLLVLLALGLALAAAWRLFDAVAGAGGALRRASSLAVVIIYAALCVRAVELVADHSASGGASSNPEPWVARIMGWPGGTVAIGVAGAVLVGAGIVLCAASSTEPTSLWRWSACLVRGEVRSRFSVASETWPEEPCSSCSASTSWTQR